jgi:hypothetical protein
MNVCFQAASNLSLGWHTVKLQLTTNSGNSPFYFGFEILNEQASGLIQLPPGSQLYKGKRLTKSTLTTTAYNSDFETGTLGTKGGKVLIYQKSDGSVAKALTPTDASALFGTSTNHANEELSNRLSFRMFGAGRTDDIATIGPASSNRVFTLDDGSTSLCGTNIFNNLNVAGFEGLSFTGNGDYATLTFFGTGLDIKAMLQSAANPDIAVVIDGVAVHTITNSHFGSAGAPYTIKIASGLSCGFHTARFVRGASAAANIIIQEFLTYEAETPALPTGAVALGAYNILGDFSVTNVSGNTVTDNADMYGGVVVKSMTREMNYVGTGWTLPALGANNASLPGGFYANTATNSDYVEHTFWGTGIAIHLIDSAGGTSTFTAAIDGVANAGATNTLSITNNGAGSYTVNTTTGFLPARLVFSGLALGKHTIRLTRTGGAGNFAIAGLTDQ